jgi:predicted negative regulator of RcsB-dependent stress response
MANFFSASQDEQVELIASIWTRFKFIIIAVLVLVVAAIVYREYSASSSDEFQLNSSSAYEAFLNSTGDKKIDSAKNLIDSYPSSLYANFALLYLAKVNVEQLKMEEAKKFLKKVLKNSSSGWGEQFNPIESLAKLRLAKILLEEGGAQEVLDLLKGNKILTASIYEIKGDAEEELGRVGEAKVSYLQALELSNSQPIRSLISMKIADLQITK